VPPSAASAPSASLGWRGLAYLTARTQVRLPQRAWVCAPLGSHAGLVLSGGYERPAFTPMLFQQLDIAHDHATVGGLAHVVDGEQADLYGGRKSVDFPRKSHC
jgi:hypothetical protein